MANELFISFIIPALNEQQMIGDTLRAIKAAMGDCDHEIIISDNGSTDGTQSIAESMDAKFIVNPTATIAELRNLGVKESQGNIYAFIDADVSLAPDWLSVLKTLMATWPADGMIVTGSTYLAPEASTFVEAHWFDLLRHSESSYINSGHLITTQAMFEKINGFDASLRTAEDYDFCHRAQQAGGQIVKRPELRAIHHGFPKTVKEFMAREAWHGREDFRTFDKFINSKTAMAATLNLLILVLAVLSLLQGSLANTIFYLLASLGIAMVLTYLKFGVNVPNNFIKTALCFEIYLLGRMQSLYFRRRRPVART